MEECAVRDCAAAGVSVGGVYTEGGATLTRCGFYGNTSTGAAGAARINGETVVTGCVFEGNTSVSHGGALFANGTLTLADSTFTGNRATGTGGVAGGAVYAYSAATVTGCTFTGNSTATVGSYGGGAFASYRNYSAEIANCTFTGNESAYRGGAVYKYDSNAPMTLTLCTITGNTAGDRGGGVSVNGSVTLRGCVIAGNFAPNRNEVESNSVTWNNQPPGAGNNYTIIGETAGYSLTDIFGDNTLADNGGATPTLLIKNNGAAHDKIPFATLDAWNILTDQRGIPRPQGDFADIGAIELQPVIHPTIGRFDPIPGGFALEWDALLGNDWIIVTHTNLTAALSEWQPLSAWQPSLAATDTNRADRLFRRLELPILPEDKSRFFRLGRVHAKPK
jgi:predicted outer membrane repeat protein